jgi:hypothetical protein
MYATDGPLETLHGYSSDSGDNPDTQLCTIEFIKA